MFQTTFCTSLETSMHHVHKNRCTQGTNDYIQDTYKIQFTTCKIQFTTYTVPYLSTVGMCLCTGLPPTRKLLVRLSGREATGRRFVGLHYHSTWINPALPTRYNSLPAIQKSIKTQKGAHKTVIDQTKEKLRFPLIGMFVLSKNLGRQISSASY